MKKINQYKRTYYKEQGALIGLIMCFVIFALPGLSDAGKEEYVADKEETSFMIPIVVVPEPTVEDKIKEYFPRSYKTVIAIAKAESSLKNDAINYNCWYDKDGNIKTTYVKNGGKSCKKEDRKYAFGVDCFVLQAHYPGRKSCPEGVTLDMHLREMADLSRQRSFQPWVVYNTGAYKAHLANN